jgi:hypothetical protein
LRRLMRELGGRQLSQCTYEVRLAWLRRPPSQ